MSTRTEVEGEKLSYWENVRWSLPGMFFARNDFIEKSEIYNDIDFLRRRRPGMMNSMV